MAEEHFAALHAAGFDGIVRVGLIGDEDNRIQARRWLDRNWPKWQPAVVADDGYEQWTIDAMHRWAKATDPDTPVMYGHTKGAYQDCPFNHNWRRSMTSLLLSEAVTEHLGRLLAEYDMIGCHWLTHEQFPVTVSEGRPMFAGNFWWAKAGYLAKLPKVEGGDPMLGYNRFKAEEWHGQLKPHVLDLKPGWPEYEDDGGYNSVHGGQLHP